MIRGRWLHYLAYFFAFLAVYGAAASLGVDPRVWPALVAVSLVKDLVDELLLRSGGTPLEFATFEHTPSNVVIILFLLTGTISVPGEAALPAVGTVGLETLTLVLAVVDTVWDLWQDARSKKPSLYGQTGIVVGELRLYPFYELVSI